MGAVCYVPRCSEGQWALGERSCLRGHLTGARLLRRLANTAQALKHIKRWGVCGHQESDADSRLESSSSRSQLALLGELSSWLSYWLCSIGRVVWPFQFLLSSSAEWPRIGDLHTLLNNATWWTLVKLRIWEKIWKWGCVACSVRAGGSRGCRGRIMPDSWKWKQSSLGHVLHHGDPSWQENQSANTNFHSVFDGFPWVFANNSNWFS